MVDHVPTFLPVMRREVNRPKKMRNKIGDKQKNPHELSRKLATVTHKKYGQMGHNKRACNGKRAADREIPKGDNKAKTKRKEKKKKKDKKASETLAKIG